MDRRKLLLAAASTLLALLVAEGALRGPFRPELADARGTDWQVQTRAMHARLHVPDPGLVYVPRPDATAEAPHGTVRHNRLGLRGGPLLPRGDRARIVVMGDSIVWGDLLDEPDTLSAQLGSMLPGAQVINAGVTGYSTVQERGWYRRRVRDLAADVVVVVYCLNDMLTYSNPYQLYAGPQARRALLAERAWLDAEAPLRNETVSRQWLYERRAGGGQLLAAVRHAWRWNRLFTLPGGYVDEFLLAARDPQRASATREALVGLGHDIRADGAEAVLVISPALYWWHRYQWDEIHELVREAGEDGGFEVIDPLREAWTGTDPTPLRFPGDNVHYTPEGIRALASVMAAKLRDRPRP